MLRDLVLILGDQLTFDNPALEHFDPAQDRVLMIEAPGEATCVWNHRARIALFLAAMRHFHAELQQRNWPCTYVQQRDLPKLPSLAERLQHQLRALKPQRLLVCEPGEWRILALLQDSAAACAVPLDVLPDTHFLCSREDFAHWARNKKEWRMEFFYRWMRQRENCLIEEGQEGSEPVGGQWNFDAKNRSAFPKIGPGEIPEPAWFKPDELTQQVLDEIEQDYAKHPGELKDFAWPVTRQQALKALEKFIEQRLPNFGRYQDAMWTDTPFGWHALLSTSLNLHLLHPREVIDAAVQAYRDGQVDLASVEGFVRQILGWREFIRGVYWLAMPQLGQANHFKHQGKLPSWYWTGSTQMACMREVVGQTLRYGYAHHIQRLMVTGQFALLAQIQPQQVCDWYLAVYVDAVEWVELPNTAGMALFADGGRFTSKPYIASGQYIKRMSNYCDSCRYRPEQRHGEQACPVTTLYWHFLDQHENALAPNPRTGLMVRNLARLSDEERRAVRQRADYVLAHLDEI